MLTGACQWFEPEASQQNATQITKAKQQPEDKNTQTDQKMNKKDIKLGTGPSVNNGMKLRVHYKAHLTDGTLIDDSRKKNKAFEFTIGQGQVIKGWEVGILGMKKGGSRRITVPPKLAYGNRGISGLVPPNESLIFTIELISIIN